jgi:hypothetical protein
MLLVNQWRLFAEFFKYCSDVNNVSNRDGYRNRMLGLYGQPNSLINSLTAAKTSLQKNISDATKLVRAKKVAGEAFKVRTDPTLLLAGIDSGWPAEYLNPVPIRFHSQIKPPSNNKNLILSNLNLPSSSGAILDTISALLNEGLGPQMSQLGFKKWAGQPFCPIFVEWEAMFYNIDPWQWAVGLGSSPMSNNNQKQVRYINPNPLHAPDSKDPTHWDTRALSGRILVLPQPSFALSAIVKQVLDVAGVNVPEPLQSVENNKMTGRADKSKVDAFVKKIEQLKFISGDLEGFTDGLLTMGTGSHVKPNIRQQGQNPEPLQEAIDIGKVLGIPDSTMTNMIKTMDSETAKTPFGTLYDFFGSKFQPFKGVQHGQLGKTIIIRTLSLMLIMRSSYKPEDCG